GELTGDRTRRVNLQIKPEAKRHTASGALESGKSECIWNLDCRVSPMPVTPFGGEIPLIVDSETRIIS
ncbi:MAG: hypothetical protein QGG01_14125, partial [Roseibacillus sp.]|nr:hypothetical protein [Roseibacillus sp.]